MGHLLLSLAMKLAQWIRQLGPTGELVLLVVLRRDSADALQPWCSFRPIGGSRPQKLAPSSLFRGIGLLVGSPGALAQRYVQAGTPLSKLREGASSALVASAHPALRRQGGSEHRR